MEMKIVKPGRFFGRAVAIACAVAVEVVASGCGVSGFASPSGDPLRQSAVHPTATSDANAAQRPDLQRALVQLASANDSGAIALVESPQETWRGASGLASSDRPAAPGDRFGIASTTKTFVATIVLQLVGEGRLSLDDSVERWLPGLVREGKRITIRQLLNHTSGIGMSYALGPLACPSRCFDSQQPLLSEPGTQHHYSNANFVILGLIVERLTGQSLDVTVRDRIFGPLGLRDSSFGSASPARAAGDLPPWLGADADVPTGAVSGAGGIVSTPADVSTFFRALLGGELLDEDQLSEMLRTVDTSGEPLAAQGAENSSGAGLGIFRLDLDCGSTWGHGGDMPGYSNQVVASRDGSKVVVVAQNTTGWPSANATALEMFCL
jgi:D-alanyl-D-alanine carboxypeptidase